MTRTRFAPSPTGFMHVGNLRTAIFAYLICKKDNGKFILRIEDTDQKRSVDGALEFIYDTLKLCGIEFDEGPLNGGLYGPYFQSERLEIYQKYAKGLVSKQKAYYCFCDEKRLEKLRKEAEERKVAFLYDGHCRNLSELEIEKRTKTEKAVIRQKIPKDGTTEYDDLVYGHLVFQNELLEDQILMKSDGYPTYNFANVIDDYLMKITHVIRGNEYLTATPKYNLLYENLGFEKPVLIHLPMVVDENGRKLGKRHGAASFIDLYQQGYIPHAVVNYLALLGWSPESTQEIFSIEELITHFDPKRINRAPAIFDIKKLNWINAQYIKKLDETELFKIVYPHLEKAHGPLEQKWARHLVKIYQDHLAYGAEIVELTKLFFEDSDETHETDLSVVNCFFDKINKLNSWEPELIKELIKEVGVELGIKGKDLFMPIRIAVSGMAHGPELPDTIYLLGKEKIIKKLEKFSV